MSGNNDFLTLYRDYSREITDAPIEFHEYMGIATIGATLGNKVFFPFGDTKIYPNFWLILIAPSSTYRKTTSLNIAKRLLSDLNPALIYPNEFSHEKILDNLAQQPTGVFCFSEFMSLSGLLSRDYMAGTKALLTDLYDSPSRFLRDTFKGKADVKDPAISIFSATTIEWLLQKISSDDIQGGFLPRFLLIYSDKKLQDLALPPMADQVKRKLMLGKLAEMSYMSGGAYLSPGARKLYEQWYKKTQVTASKFHSFYQRLQTYLLKIAMVLAVNNENSLKISEDIMQAAIGYINWLRGLLTTLQNEEFVFGKFEKEMKEVSKFIRKSEVVTRSELLRSTRFETRVLNRVLETLIDREQIIITKEKKEGICKPVTLIKWV